MLFLSTNATSSLHVFPKIYLLLLQSNWSNYLESRSFTMTNLTSQKSVRIINWLGSIYVILSMNSMWLPRIFLKDCLILLQSDSCNYINYKLIINLPLWWLSKLQHKNLQEFQTNVHQFIYFCQRTQRDPLALLR